MKHIQLTCIGLAVAGGFLLAGCGKTHDHDHGAARGTAEAKPYPLDVCIVADEKLGSMGDAIVRVHESQEVKFCCKDCVGEFEADPEKYLAKLKQ